MIDSFKSSLADTIAWCESRLPWRSTKDSLRSRELQLPHLLTTPSELDRPPSGQEDPKEWNEYRRACKSNPDFGGLSVKGWRRFLAEQAERTDKPLSVEQWKNSSEWYLQKRAREQSFWTQVEIERTDIVNALCKRRAALLAERHPGGSPSRDRGLLGGRLLACSSPSRSISSGESEMASEGFFDLDDLPPLDTWCCYVPQGSTSEHPARKTPDFFLIRWVPSQFVNGVQKGIDANPYDCICWADSVDMEFTRLLRKASLLG